MTMGGSIFIGLFEFFFDVLFFNKVCSEILSGSFNINKNANNILQEYNTSFIYL